MARFTKDMNIQEALLAHPAALDVFLKHGMDCIDCMGSAVETIEAGALMHGIDVDQLLFELNCLLNESEGERP